MFMTIWKQEFFEYIGTWPEIAKHTAQANLKVHLQSLIYGLI